MTVSESIPIVSMVVPVWGDDERVIELISGQQPDDRLEWIVAALDPSEALVQFIEKTPGVRLVTCDAPSRGGQQHSGFQAARGKLICFHHADSLIDQEQIAVLIKIAEDPSIAGGAFHRKFDASRPFLKMWDGVVRFISARGGPFFGDQSIFVRAEVYRKMGGFARIPLMEDLEFSRRLRRIGKVVIVDPPLRSSPRRFARLGTWKASGINVLFVILFYLGVSPFTLHRWYYRDRVRTSSRSVASPSE